MALRRFRRTPRGVPPRHNVDLQLGIGSRYVSDRQAQFAANDVAALGDGTRFAERDVAVAALTTKATVAGTRLDARQG